MNQKRILLLSHIALVSAALIWGGSFIVMKNVVNVFPPSTLLAMRFGLGCLFLSLIFIKQFKDLDKSHLKSGALIGLFLFLAYYVQTTGLMTTTPGKNAFLTASYCVIVPFLFWAVDRHKPSNYNLVAAFLCIFGIGLVSLDGDLTMSTGDILSLLSGFFFAAHMVSVAKLSRGKNMIIITILQFGVASLLATLVAIPTETFPQNIPTSCWYEMGFLVVFATGCAILFQNIGLKHVNPATGTLILSLESVFAILFSVLFYGEVLTLQLVLGFILIFVAILVAETKLSFLKKRPSSNIEI